MHSADARMYFCMIDTRCRDKRPLDAAHVPDDDLFALCAARTWTVSLRDSIWLRQRPEFCAID